MAIFSLVDILRRKRVRHPGSIHRIAQEVGVSVNTLKRIFDQGVLGGDQLAIKDGEIVSFPMVEKTKGGHWRLINPDQHLPAIKVAVMVWKFYARKGAQRQKKEQYDISEILFQILQAKNRCVVLTANDYLHAKDMLGDGTLDLCNEDLQKLYNAEDPKLFAVFLLGVKAKLLQLREGRPISVKELANFMGISVATLYRPPFGRSLLKRQLSPATDDREGLSKEQQDTALEFQRDSKRTR